MSDDLDARMLAAARLLQGVILETRSAFGVVYTWNCSDVDIQTDFTWQKFDAKARNVLTYDPDVELGPSALTIRGAAVATMAAGVENGELRVGRDFAFWLRWTHGTTPTAGETKILFIEPRTAQLLSKHGNKTLTRGEIRSRLTAVGSALRRGSRICVSGSPETSAHEKAETARVFAAVKGGRRTLAPLTNRVPGITCTLQRTPAGEPDAVLFGDIGYHDGERFEPWAIASLEGLAMTADAAADRR